MGLARRNGKVQCKTKFLNVKIKRVQNGCCAMYLNLWKQNFPPNF
jgi:hypothetical protein